MKEITILLFKDNSINLGTFKESLSEEKEDIFKLISVNNLDEGLEIITQEKIDIILMDLTLSKKQELERFEKVYNFATDIPIIILTGYYDRETAIKALSIGAQDYLLPINLTSELIIRSIKYAIERNKIRLELREALNNIKTLNGLLPICIKCKKIHNDEGYWQRIEAYISQKSDMEFAQTICPACLEKAHNKI
jgi:DNA-binding NtrC family response regulator